MQEETYYFNKFNINEFRNREKNPNIAIFSDNLSSRYTIAEEIGSYFKDSDFKLAVGYENYSFIDKKYSHEFNYEIINEYLLFMSDCIKSKKSKNNNKNNSVDISGLIVIDRDNYDYDFFTNNQIRKLMYNNRYYYTTMIINYDIQSVNKIPPPMKANTDLYVFSSMNNMNNYTRNYIYNEFFKSLIPNYNDFNGICESFRNDTIMIYDATKLYNKNLKASDYIKYITISNYSNYSMLSNHELIRKHNFDNIENKISEIRKQINFLEKNITNSNKNLVTKIMESKIVELKHIEDKLKSLV